MNSEKDRSVNWEKLKKNKLWYVLVLAVLALQIMTLFYFGNKKEGFHEDEYYSYYSTNRTAGLFEPDREWMDSENFSNEFVVLEGEGFRYGLVATVQSWDVHPPFYYFILHTACSLFPGVFSKWLGIGINIIAFVINAILLYWLSYMVTNKNRMLALVVTTIYGFSAAAVSGVMFIRMYEWLTVFVLLCACLHVRAVVEAKNNFKSFLLPLMAVTYLGFLTQYYYIIFLFFIACGYCLFLLFREKKLLGCIKYGISCGTALLLAVLSYRASFSHIFRGYRGTGAASEFLNAENTWDRLGFFARLVNDYLFDGWLWLWLGLLAVVGIAMAIFRITDKSKKAGIAEGITEEKELEKVRNVRSAYFLLLFAVCGYFFTVSKTALLLYETSNRYQLPIYGIIQLLLITAFYFCGKKLANQLEIRKFLQNVAIVIFCLLFLVADIHGLASGKVIFLYEGDGELVEYARENADQPVVVFYNDTTPYHVWWRSQELMEYDRIYFASEANPEQIEDETICGSDKLIVYAADHERQQESLNALLESNPKLSEYKVIAKRSLWSIYEFH